MYFIVDEDGSDLLIVDNVLEFLLLVMEFEKVVMLLILELWLYNEFNDKKVCFFYEFYSYLMELWDGLIMIFFCNGDKIGVLIDRNGLRFGCYIIIKDNFIVFFFEVGVIDVLEENVVFKG